MSYDAAYWCSVALLSGLELQSGKTHARRGDARDAYEQAQLFIQTVGDDKALQAAHEALRPRAKSAKKGRIKWL